MIATIEQNGSRLSVNFAQPIDISLPLKNGADNPNAYFIQNPVFEPFRADGFVGSVAEGGACNCENLLLNAHGNGTHTECVGHITPQRVGINECLKTFMFVAALVSITPEQTENGDSVITRHAIEHQFSILHSQFSPDAFILRTLPNTNDKRLRRYSGANPPYLHHEAASLIAEHGIKHLLLDVPSVDREEDGGRLSSHKAFWCYSEGMLNTTRFDATITEMVFVPNDVPDGAYLLNLQIASIESDASPSKPVLYRFIS